MRVGWHLYKCFTDVYEKLTDHGDQSDRHARVPPRGRADSAGLRAGPALAQGSFPNWERGGRIPSAPQDRGKDAGSDALIGMVKWCYGQVAVTLKP